MGAAADSYNFELRRHTDTDYDVHPTGASVSLALMAILFFQKGDDLRAVAVVFVCQLIVAPAVVSVVCLHAWLKG